MTRNLILVWADSETGDVMNGDGTVVGKIVPIEPTTDMMAAAWEQAAVYSKTGWAAMLAAAPQPGVKP